MKVETVRNYGIVQRGKNMLPLFFPKHERNKETTKERERKREKVEKKDVCVEREIYFSELLFRVIKDTMKGHFPRLSRRFPSREYSNLNFNLRPSSSTSTLCEYPIIQQPIEITQPHPRKAPSSLSHSTLSLSGRERD